jgi:predicted heme/steroid binding protein
MASSAVMVTFFIGPRIKKKLKAGQAGDVVTGDKDLAPAELHHFDGKEGRPAYLAYHGKIYDVTGSRLWKDGSHARKHQAGNDLTDVLKTAPHGEDKVLAMKLVGELKPATEKPQRPFHEKMFYFFAYMNLAFVFVIAFVIALMRWT